jgi:hypothetical protein
VIEAKRMEYLNKENIKQILSQQAVKFVIVNLGDKLKWIDERDCFDFWKKTAKQNIAETERIILEDFPREFAFGASRWVLKDETIIIVLEMFH